jgi:hypothetical protein
MDGEAATSASAEPEKSGARQRSSIGFPYSDLKASVELAEAIHKNVGRGSCDDAQLAAWTGQSPKSSGFRTQVYGARMFGVLKGDGGNHSLTSLGHEIVDPKRARAAKAKAFQSVPLYKAVFDKYNGGIIPPPAALERDFVGLGVAEKQKDRARQIFERSAEQAGYFEHGKDRLVAPGVVSGLQEPEDEKPGDEDHGNGGGTGGGTGNGVLDALLHALPKAGTEWSADERVSWLQMVAMAMNMAYGKGEALIEVKKVATGSGSAPKPPNEGVSVSDKDW